MKELSEPEKKEELKKLQKLRQQLELYRKQRSKNQGLFLSIKDWFRSSSYDPNSVTRRVQTCLHLEAQIAQVIALGSKTPVSPEFNAAAIELVQSISAKIQDNPDRSSRQRIFLSGAFNPLVRILSKVSDEPTRAIINRAALKHMNFSLADRLVEHQQARLTDIVTSPSNWFSRIRDYVFPKARDKRMAELNGVISNLQACEYAEDYRSLLKNTELMVTQVKKTDSSLADLLTQITAPIRRQLKQNSIPVRPTSAATLPSKTEGHPLDDTMAYFEKKMRPQLTYQLLVHGLGSQGEFQREPGILGHIGITIGNVGSLLPFGKVGGALVGQVLVFAEGQQQSQKDACLAEKVPHHLLDKVVMRVVEELMHDLAGPLSKLYYSPLYTRALDKLVDRIVSNIVASLQEVPEIVLSDQNQLTIYKELIESRRKKGHLNAEEQHQMDSIHADLLAKHAAAGAFKRFTRTPMAGWVTTTHLMHKDDENALFGGEGLNLFSIFDKPGRIVVNDDGSLQFYVGVNQRPDKYGYVFTTAAEVKKLGLLEEKFPDTDTIKYYEKLHNAYAVKKTVPQVTRETVATKPVAETASAQQVEQIAEKLKAMGEVLVMPGKSFTNEQLKLYRQELMQIKAEIKQNKSLKETEVPIGTASFPLSIHLQLVEDKLNGLMKAQLDLLQKEQFAIKLTKSLVDQVAVTATAIGIAEKPSDISKLQTVKVLS